MSMKAFMFGLFWIMCMTVFHTKVSSAHEAILMDTRTATSDVGWTMSQGSEWHEVSSSHPDGRELRMLMVCQIKKPKQNNWVRTPYIPVQGASRVYVEFEFTIRSCEDVPNVATCKETFNLYYYETDSEEATTTFPPWREGAYVKVDTIAADKRFRPGSAETNFETRDIGPLTKNGIYLALQDTGACMALMHVRVYYKYCTPIAENLASFARTIAGPERTSLVESKGICVANAITENGLNPSLHCNSDGEWDVPKGTCICGAGYSPSSDLTSCQACGRGHYKSSVGNRPCQRCPAYSHSRDYGSTVCDCMFGYYRAPTDQPSAPCTKPPGKPLNLRASVNETWVTLTWERPLHDGGRDDMTYSVECSRCQSGYTACASCSGGVDYLPGKFGLRSNKVKVQDLSSYAYYKFKVYAENGVSRTAYNKETDNNYAIVTLETSQARPSMVVGVQVTDVGAKSFIVSWSDPMHMNGRILEYEVHISLTGAGQEKTIVNRTTSKSIKVIGLDTESKYLIQVRARTNIGFGPFSAPYKAETATSDTTPSGHEQGGQEINMLQLILAVVAGSVLVILVIVGICCFRKRSKKYKNTKVDMDKIPMFSNFTLKSISTYPSVHKTYIDPTTYEDPQRAVLEFTKEIDSTYVNIEQVIGGGEFGEVCRGKVLNPSKKEEHDVAIKTLKSGYSTQQRLDFLGEASIMGQFDHPNVIRLEGVVTKSRPLMIITEYMENGSLDTFLRKHDGEFTVIQLVGILRNIAAGMKYLSDMGYVHRDLAARNILVNAQLICKVSDFGLSRVLEEDSDATYTTRGGKIPIRWTAPEAITYRKFTSSSDVWSFGIVMWEVMSYGERPYWGMSNQDVIQAVGSGYRLPAPMDCPQVQHHLMLECWKKDRAERPKFAQIVSSLDKMLRDPSQLKLIASENSNGHLVNERGSLARFSSFSPPPDGANDPLLPKSGAEIPLTYMRNSLDLSSLGNWLESIEFGGYKENFLRSGYNLLEQVLQITPSDLSRIGVTDVNHQDIILDSVEAIRRRSDFYPIDPPQYTDERISGIPV
ncbi:ephrin type-A receptor 4-like [Clavelina lepadiformis]|uniref:ephrin type-A receptor 4-like n=1 Tax=Clavelina lepadiformis TaxID=159417 RepID=UPI004042A8F5